MYKKYIKYTGITLAVFILLSIIAALYVADTFSRRIIYKKAAEIEETRERLITQYGAQPVRFITQDNIEIAALLVKRAQAKRVVIVCHGFKHTKERMADFVTLFPNDTLLLIDLRGQGESEGNRISLGLQEHLDVVAAVDYIKNNVSANLPIIGVGVSQGGSAILRAAAAGAPFNAIIIDSAPSEFKNTIACVLNRKYIPIYITRLALRIYQYGMRCSLAVSDYRNFVQGVTCPVLIMHDSADYLIDYAHGQTLYNALCCQNKHLYRAQGTRHGKMFKQIPREYSNCIEEFLRVL